MFSRRRLAARIRATLLSFSLVPLWLGTSPGQAHPERWPQSASQGLVEAKTEAFVSGLMARMSLEEKVGQLVQADVSAIRPEDLRSVPLGAILAGGNTPALGANGLRSGAADWIATARAFRRVAQEQRPGHVPIPLLFGVDAVHGDSHVLGATVFPHNIGLGASFDADLVYRIGVATAQETAASGFDWAFAPTVAAPLDARWGRFYEGYSLDPARVGKLGAALVRGLQGLPGSRGIVESGHVAASAKHFIGDGATHDGIDQGDAQIGEDQLIAVQAPGYTASIQAGVMSVMTSFSSWQGVKNTGNRSLVSGVLKGRMGFDGIVVSDWNSFAQIPGCSAQDCAAAILAGVDMLMAPNAWKPLYENLMREARSGEIPAQRIDDAVRRILRVKARLGLFDLKTDVPRPWERRSGVLGSPRHRALAREAVRDSIVLLKNEGGVLPIRRNARILVAGSGADDIGRQCGGWTLSWQGTGNTNRDFPNGSTILDGLRKAIVSGAGSVQWDPNGAFQARPDVAVVVFGEAPYAEGWGDLRSLEFEAGDKSDLALLRRLKAQGLPVVSVFLSGRPLWVNPELNASDAFVAAFLPGSEGAGIADVLVARPDGKPNHDFHATLSFPWPNSAAPGRPALFPIGYGLRYARPAKVAMLDESPGIGSEDVNFSRYFVRGHAVAPWHFVLRDAKSATEISGATNASRIDGRISMRAVDAQGLQEGGRELTWTGGGHATVAIVGSPVDMRMMSNGEAALQLVLRVDEPPTAPVQLALGCGTGCGAGFDVTANLRAARPDEWQHIKLKLSCFRDAGADVSRVSEPFALTSEGHMRLSIADVQLTSDPSGAICPARP